MKVEVIYILAILGYYAYKFFFKKGKDAEDSSSKTVLKKRKNVFEEFIEKVKEEAKHQTELNQPTPAKTNPRKKKKQYQPVNIPVPNESVFIYEEGQSSTHNYEETAKDVHIEPRKPKKFGKMNMTAKEALIAQIILEKKF
ncbi:MAG: hypothetical protein LC105_04505 [Chitinophagales bacterium]|nr:hypothetical protein [Chitinophagales bacterium]MCZ2393104.1 hypothetical protein [Chitinophagales bacterium]